jgi:hypothetical protein
LGSKTTHWVPRYTLSSKKSAVRRTGMYFHSSVSWSAQGVCAPDHPPNDRKGTQAVEAENVEPSVLAVVEVHLVDAPRAVLDGQVEKSLRRAARRGIAHRQID